MAQRQTFTREKILDAAFTLVREKGWRSGTARSIAKALGASTMPIYSSVRSMEEVAQELGSRSYLLMQDYQKRSYTDNPMLNLAVGYVMFARHEPNLFRFMYQEKPFPVAVQDVQRQAEFMNRSFSSVPGVREGLDDIPGGPASPLVLNSWIYTHGLASMVSNGVLNITDEQIAQLLNDAGGAFYLWSQSRAEAGKEDKE